MSSEDATPPEKRSLYARVYLWLGHRRWFAALARRYGARLDAVIFRSTRGRIAPTAVAAPMLLLTTTGRRTGQPRTTPVIYVRDGRSFILSSEDFGQQRAAAWPLNLMANPEATVDLDGKRVRCRARLLDDAEADRHWPALVRAWPAHETYRSRNGKRQVFALEPLDADADSPATRR